MGSGDRENLGAKGHKEDDVKKAQARAKLQVIQDNVKMAEELREALQVVAPNCPIEVVSSIAVDLADLVFVCSKHRLHVNKIVKLTEPHMKSKLKDVLAEIEVNLLFEAQFHLTSLKKDLPKLVRSVYKQS